MSECEGVQKVAEMGLSMLEVPRFIYDGVTSMAKQMHIN